MSNLEVGINDKSFKIDSKPTFYEILLQARLEQKKIHDIICDLCDDLEKQGHDDTATALGIVVEGLQEATNMITHFIVETADFENRTIRIE